MLIDNKKNGKVGDALKEHIQKNCSLSIVSAYFTIYAYEALKKELSKKINKPFIPPVFFTFDELANDIAKNYYNQKEISYKNWIFHRDMEKMVKFLGKL